MTVCNGMHHHVTCTDHSVLNAWGKNFIDIFLGKCIIYSALAVNVPLDAYVMDFVFSEKEEGGIFDNKNGMDYHIPVFKGIAKEPPMHIVHISVEMAPIAKVRMFCGSFSLSPCKFFMANAH